MVRLRSPEELAAHADAIHVAALEVPVEARWRLLSEACAGDPELRAAVELRLIGARTTPGHSTEPAYSDFGEAHMRLFRPGTVVGGRYRILHRIGEGGLGTVFLADQELPVRRKVALKVLHAGLGSRTAAIRFEAEIAALSRMNHPWVASIHDAGRTPEGALYVVMEYIDGEPLDVFCTNHSLDLEATLRLFVKVCRGVQHAHQRGILHRDLKPMNVLVKADDEPTPRIIDFGIARGALGDPGLGPRITSAGAHVGTPEYMSPEQAGLLDAEPDTAADVYSLGVMLYELLTGTLPVDFDGRRDPGHWRRVLAETRVVPPSDAVARRHKGRAPHPSARLRGDLDAVVMKALAREPDRRYASAAELAADIDRYLAGRPIVARSPGPLHVLGRAILRRPGVAVAVVAAVVALIGAVSVRDQLAFERASAELAIREANAQRVVAEATARNAQRTSARSSLVAAITSLWLDDAPAVLGNLEAIPPPLRGWGSRLLRGLVERWEHRFELGAGATTGMAFSGDERLVCAGGADGVVRCLDAATGAPRTTVAAIDSPIADLHLDDAGRRALVSDRDASLALVDLERAEVLWLRRGPIRLVLPGFVTGPDGHEWILAALPEPDAESAWRPTRLDPATGGGLDRLPVSAAPVPSLHACHREDGLLLLVSTSATTTAFGIDGRHVWSAPGRLVGKSSERDCAFGLFMETADYGFRSVRSLVDGRQTGELRAPNGDVVIAAVGPGGRLAWRVDVGAVVMRDDGAGMPPVPLRTSRTPTHALRFSADGSRLWVADDEGALTVFRTELSSQPSELKVALAPNLGAVISRDGRRHVSTGWGWLRVIDAERRYPLWQRWLGRHYATAVAFTPSESRLALGDWVGAVTLLDAQVGDVVLRANLFDVPIVSIAAVDESTFAVGTASGEVAVLTVPADGGPPVFRWRRTIDPRLPVMRLALGHDRRSIAVGLGNPAHLPEGGGLPAARTVRVRAAVPDRAGIVLLGLDDGRELLAFEGSRATWRALAIAPDGRALFGSAESGVLHRWDMESGALTARRPGVGGAAVGLVFTGEWSGDDRSAPESEPRIVAALDSGNVAIWDGINVDFMFFWRVVNDTPLAISVSSDERLLGVVSKTVSSALLTLGDAGGEDGWRDRVVASIAATALEHHVDPKAASDAILAGRFLPPRYGLDSDDGRALAVGAAAWARSWRRNPNHLNSLAWGEALHRESWNRRSQAEKDRALALAEAAVVESPRHEFVNTLALVRFRRGDFAGAVEAARRSVALAIASGGGDNPLDASIEAMSLKALGRPEEAAAAVARAEAMVAREPWRGDADARVLFDEAVRALKGVAAR